LAALFLATTVLTSVTGFFFPVSGFMPSHAIGIVVGIVQAFQKVSFLQPLAPTQSEPPFLVAQLVVMAIFIVLGVLAVRKVHPAKGRNA
jgi:hypothetical protein